MRFTKLLLVLVASLLFISTAYANDQTVVIGLGMGGFVYNTVDTPREGSGGIWNDLDTLDKAGQGKVFIEWYLFGDIGIGFHNITTSSGVKYIGAYTEITREVSISNNFVTAQWIFSGSEDYTRLGIIGGIGSSTYTWNYKCESRLSSGCSFNEINLESKGQATLGGVFIDWGAEDFGARFGYTSITTTGYGEFKETSTNATLEVDDLDGSGGGIYFDLRWAW